MTDAETEKKTSEHGNEAMEQNESEKEGEARAIKDAIKTTEGTIKSKVTGPTKFDDN